MVNRRENMNRGIADAAVGLQIIADHLAHDARAGADSLVLAIGIALADDRHPIAVDEHLRYGVGIDKAQVRRLAVRDGALVPAAAGLILAARPPAAAS